MITEHRSTARSTNVIIPAGTRERLSNAVVKGAQVKLQHVLEVDQFTRADLDTILAHARAMRGVAEKGIGSSLTGRILATLFYEPSTRTRLSFESAMLRLGGQVLSSEMAAETSSAVKGESIPDTIRIVESYADVITIRHPNEGTADEAASVASVPILNAGDGAREHPTQALLDLYTIQDELGRIDDISVALVGDLRYGRAPRSLARLLTRVRNCRIVMVAPSGIEMADDVLQALREAGVEYSFETSLEPVMGDVDVVYMTRVQKERFPTEDAYRAVAGQYHLESRMMNKLADNAIVMHPLPRVDEIHADVDADPRAAYFRQARNGVYIRMALLDLLLNGDGSTLTA